jgi:arylsulfatase A-like enzyme
MTHFSALTAMLLTVGGVAAGAERPNVVLILADDLGYGDLSCYGCPDLRTPRLDRLAQQGVLLTDCYSNASVCSPTRAALMTGRYQQRIGLEWAVYYQVGAEGLPPGETSIAQMIRHAGYATAMSGKWHLGYDAGWTPNDHGFEHFLGSLGGNIHYFQHVDRLGVPDLFLDRKPVNRTGYATDLTADYAVQCIDRMAGGPFFLYVAFNAPHFPYQGPDDADRVVRPRTRAWQQGSRRSYVAMVERLDQAVGRIVDAVDEHGLGTRTLIVFTSDNGGATYSRNEPCSKGKGTLWEGGIRVPGIARWTGVLPAGARSPQVACTMDWGVTAVKLAGAAPPADRPFDGIDLLPILRGDKPAVERTLFWRRSPDPHRRGVEPHRAVRQGDWKYIDQPDGTQYLYDLAHDVGEQHNLAEEYPQRASELKRLLDAWEGDVDPPLYDQRKK